MSLNLDYRPDSFEELYGNEDVVASAKLYVDGIKDGTKKRHSILITGPSGCGKTTLARIIATELGCYDPESVAAMIDFIEINASDQKGVETIRGIRKQMSYAPVSGKFKVYFIDEAHKLTVDAQEAFLKYLEDTPAHVVFIVATTNPEKLKDTFKRRCALFTLKPLGDEDLTNLLNEIIEAEEKKVPEEVVSTLVEMSCGSPGIALGALDTIIDLPPKQMKANAKQAVEQQVQTIALCRLMLQKASWGKISKVLGALKEQNEDAEGIRRLVLAYCSNILIKGNDPQAYNIMDCFREPLYDLGFPGLVLYAFETTQ